MGRLREEPTGYAGNATIPPITTISRTASADRTPASPRLLCSVHNLEAEHELSSVANRLGSMEGGLVQDDGAVKAHTLCHRSAACRGFRQRKPDSATPGHLPQVKRLPQAR